MLVLIILSIIQGLTEFLPVSSSGHLVLAKEWLGFEETGIEMEMWLHLATLVSLVVYFWKDIVHMTLAVFGKREANPDEKNWPWLIVAATVITGTIGVLGRDYFVDSFSDLRLVYIGFVVTATILLATRMTREKRAHLTWLDAVLFGFAQAFAIMPSISRSGTTIAILLFLGVTRSAAFRFSFLASIPAIFGAFVLEFGLGDFSAFSPAELAASFVVTFAVGYGSLALLRRFVVQHKFYMFGYYCLALGLIGLFLF